MKHKTDKNYFSGIGVLTVLQLYYVSLLCLPLTIYYLTVSNGI